MAQHPAPTEREQATLVRKWAKETRPGRGRQIWVAHAFATSFKNWVKEYEAGDINANPAGFGPSADADGEADPDPDHEPDQDPDTSVSSAAQPQLQFTAGPYIANEQPQNRNGIGNGARAGSSYSNGQFSSTPPIGPVPPPIATPQAFSRFNVPQEAGEVGANAEEEQKAEETDAAGTNGEVNANANANAPNAAGFPPMYPLVYPPVESEQKEGV
ncbi:hypothetical protein FRC06_008621 [Ceratobasidium sp. 370]|nr:hypothetical protein FRC06_008621 [Ceratobasidium sp. 370]